MLYEHLFDVTSNIKLACFALISCITNKITDLKAVEDA